MFDLYNQRKLVFVIFECILFAMLWLFWWIYEKKLVDIDIYWMFIHNMHDWIVDGNVSKSDMVGLSVVNRWNSYQMYQMMTITSVKMLKMSLGGSGKTLFTAMQTVTNDYPINFRFHLFDFGFKCKWYCYKFHCSLEYLVINTNLF